MLAEHIRHIPIVTDMIIIRIPTIIIAIVTIRTGTTMVHFILIQIWGIRTTITVMGGIIILITTDITIIMTAVLMRCGKVSEL